MSEAIDTGHTARPPAPGPLALSGDYVLREELGTGAVGTVYRAELRRAAHGLPAGAEVAIKFLRRELADDPAAADRLRREGELGMRIDSPFIAKIHGVLNEQVLGLPVVGLVMELVRGPTLRRFLRERGPAVDDLVRRIGEDAALGLHALHASGLVHRDVKPENMALTPEGRVKLMDLGLAWAADARPGSGGFFGSIAYAAPEVLRNRPAGPASDLYALGVVLFEVLTGRHPFADVLGDPDQLLAAHLDRDPARPAHVNARVSPFLEAVVLDLLRKEPLVRGFDAETLARTLAEGELSSYWQERVREAPVQAALRRLRAVRRFAPTAFFGRRAELAQLHRRLETVLATGKGTAARVIGAEGIGRRRLLDEWLAQALDKHGGSIEFVAGAGDPDPTHPRGAPFPAILADLLLDGDRADSPRARERIEVRLRALGAALADLDVEPLARLVIGEPSPLAPEARAELLVRGLLALTHGGPARRALVVRIDRADQLDTTARAVVDKLLARVGEHPVLVVLVQHLRQAQQGFGFPDVAVKGLEPEAFLQFGRALFTPDSPPSTEQIEAACASLGGNPGALIEALDELVQQHVLQGVPGSLRGLAADVEIRPAPPLLARVRQRVHDLAPEQRSVLQAAAVLGTRFPLADLVALVEQPELHVLAALSLFQGRVIRADGDEVAFRHRDFRTALLDIVPRDTRRALHLAAGRVLLQRQAPPLAIGMHLSRALVHDAAVAPLLSGLAALVAAGSRRAAGRVIARLQVHLASLPDDATTDAARCQMHALATEVALRNGDLTAAAGHAQHLLRRASARGDHAARARALLVLAQVAELRDQALAALSTLDGAEAAADAAAAHGADESAALQAEVCIKRAEIQLGLGNSNAALDALQRARGVLAESASTHVALHVAEAQTELLRAHVVSARKTAEHAAELARAAGDPLGEARAGVVLTAALAAIGDGELAQAQQGRVADSSAHAASPRLVARATLAVGELFAWRGDVAGARKHLLAAFADAHAERDVEARETAALWLRLLGIPVPRAQREDTASPHAVVRVLRALANAKDAHSRRDGSTLAAEVEGAARIERTLDLPLHVRLLVLRAAGAGTRADELANEVAQRLPIIQRRRFLRLVASAARLLPVG